MKIDHPLKKDYQLNYQSLIGQENTVFYRGRITNKNQIELPHFWPELIEETSISVHLTPIGAHQDIIVKRIGQNRVWLQAKGGFRIDCYYFVMGERRDVSRIIPEELLDTTD